MPDLRDALETALVENPDDLAAHMAHADWLSEQPDAASQARAEFIRVQLALEDPHRSPEECQRLKQREQELLRQHRAEWLGELEMVLRPDDKPAEVTFARGWIDYVRIRLLTVALARQLVTADLRLLRRLEILDCAQEDQGDFPPGDDVDDISDELNPGLSVLHACKFPNVQTLTLGEVDGRDDSQFDPSCIPLYDMPKLREWNVGIRIREAELDPFFRTDQFRALEIFRADGVEVGRGNSLWQLTRDGLHQLKTLQLWNARITDDGAWTLAGCKDLKRLDLLDLSFNHVSPEGIATLKKTGVNLIAEYQTPEEVP